MYLELQRPDQAPAAAPEPVSPAPAQARLPDIMGILNVTPDSFSDGGHHVEADRAIARAQELIRDGAAILDVGAESSRPGSRPIAEDEQIRRLTPVLRALSASPVAISVDTRSARVMAHAHGSGARILNDVSALRDDPDLAALAARLDLTVILSHGIAGFRHDAPEAFSIKELSEHFAERIGFCRARGIARNRIWIDPGIGFGKAYAGNVEVLAQLGALTRMGHPVVVGLSRKLSAPDATPEVQLATSIGGAIIAAAAGAAVIRVHDVAPTRAALRLWGRCRDAAA